ncbi:hypothetical protein [Streptomyces zaomyceticus]|uniref:Secreted protein n=1 Tax=Streptomyces zaomyceticus TaxID=68286 RepID=A0ABZ1LNG5_9ACTN|nr:hypothetical protein OG237_42090 [Streptomyces zaomyceticus]
MAISRARKALLLGLGSALTITASTLGVAHAEPVTGAVAAATATTTTEEMPLAVETLNYPNAATIKADTGALLKRGNGNLVMKTCTGTDDILIYSRVGIRDFCFDVKAKPAYLTLEIPQAYGIWTTNDPVKTTLKETDGTVSAFNAPANDFTGFGESGSTDGEGTILVELRING